jgi:lysyl-tRNA synthetase class 2
MSETATWQPSASIPNLLKRAAIMTEIRRFFADRGVLEVETPCMSQATAYRFPPGASCCRCGSPYGPW